MNPTNDRPDLLLDDGMWVTCYFMCIGERGWDRCETHATERIGHAGVSAIRDWCVDHPRHTIWLYPSGEHGYLCDTHLRVWTETVGELTS